MNARNSLLAISLSCAVPLCILELKKRGGPTEADVERVTSEVPRLLGEHGDVLLNPQRKGTGKKPKAAEVFNKVAEAIAVLAFSPGGVDIFGMHFEERRDGRWEKDS